MAVDQCNCEDKVNKKFKADIEFQPESVDTLRYVKSFATFSGKSAL